MTDGGTVITQRNSVLPDGHDGLDVTNERIRTAHSLMAAEWLKGDEDVHQAYKQGHDERCYICALLARNERLQKALERIEETCECTAEAVASKHVEPCAYHIARGALHA